MGGIVTGIVVGLVVALAGAVTNYYVAKRQDERRWEREDLTRHHQERLSAYRTMLAAVTVERLGFVNDDEAMGYWLMESVLEQATKAVSELHSEVLLLTSSPRVREASASINAQALLLRRKVPDIDGKSPLGDRELGRFTDPLLEARSEFLAAAREELGIETR